jgi:hypothetical protein
MILDESNLDLVNRKNLVSNYDVVPDVVVMGKEWVAECQ